MERLPHGSSAEWRAAREGARLVLLTPPLLVVGSVEQPVCAECSEAPAVNRTHLLQSLSACNRSCGGELHAEKLLHSSCSKHPGPSCHSSSSSSGHWPSSTSARGCLAPCHCLGREGNWWTTAVPVRLQSYLHFHGRKPYWPPQVLFLSRHAQDGAPCSNPAHILL